MGEKESWQKGVTRRDFIKTAGVAGAGAVGTGLLPRNSMAKEKVIHWRLQANSIAAPPTKTYKYVGHSALSIMWIDWVKEATNGRLIIDRKEMGSIVKGGECFDAVSTRIIDAASGVYAAFHGGITPESDIIIGLPLAWTDAALAFDGLYRRGIFEVFKEVYAEHNLYPFFHPGNAIYHLGTTMPINKPEDLKGKKIRAVGIYGDYVKAFGASPVSMPHGEVYMALKMGAMDGAIVGLYGGIIQAKTIEVCKYYVIEPNLNTVVLTDIVNLDAWKELPPDIRERLERDSKYLFLAAAYQYQVQRDRAIAMAKKEMGLKTIVWSEEDQARTRRMIIEKLWPNVAAKSPRCAKLVDMVKAQLKDLGKL